MKHTPLLPSAVALALALTMGAAWAQSSSATSAGGGNTGSSVTGGGAAPAVQAGEGTRNKPSKKDDQLARADRKFIEEAAGSGMFEVQVSQLAATKATDPAVKSYASMLVDHHSAANNELIQLANSKGVELPPAPPRSMRNEMDKLGKKSGADFDRDYVREVGIKAHQKDIKQFQKASKDVKDPELKAWVTKTLPSLEQHLAQAQKLPQAGDKGKGGSGANKTGS